MISELLPESFKFVVIELIDFILNEYNINDLEYPEVRQSIYIKILCDVKIYFSLFLEINDINYIYKSLQILNDIDVLINMISIELYTGIYMLITFKENQISLSYDYNHMELLKYINTSQK